MTLTPALVRYRLTGVSRGSDGRIRCPNRVFAKVSRPDVAERFMRPAPEKLLEALVLSGGLTEEEAELGRRVPVAEDITAEADSGGHTDHRPLVALLPTLLRLAARVSAEERYVEEGFALRVGAAGASAIRPAPPLRWAWAPPTCSPAPSTRPPSRPPPAPWPSR